MYDIIVLCAINKYNIYNKKRNNIKVRMWIIVCSLFYYIKKYEAIIFFIDNKIWSSNNCTVWFVLKQYLSILLII